MCDTRGGEERISGIPAARQEHIRKLLILCTTTVPLPSPIAAPPPWRPSSTSQRDQALTLTPMRRARGHGTRRRRLCPGPTRRPCVARGAHGCARRPGAWRAKCTLGARCEVSGAHTLRAMLRGCDSCERCAAAPWKWSWRRGLCAHEGCACVTGTRRMYYRPEGVCCVCACNEAPIRCVCARALSACDPTGPSD